MGVTLERTNYQDYSSDYKANAIAEYQANGCNLKHTAAVIGVHPETLRYWVRTEIQPKRPLELADKFDKIANLATDTVLYRLSNPELAKEINVTQLMTAAAISVDKSQLLRGQPTSIVENISAEELTVVFASALDDCIDITPAQPLVLDQPTDR